MYRLSIIGDGVIRVEDGAVIPNDPDNRDFIAYQEWASVDGNAAEPADVPPVGVPSAVTMRQARLALLQAGKLTTVNDAVAAMPGSQGAAARIEWEYSQEVQRHKALVLALAPVLGLDDAQLDALFIAASVL